MRILQINKYYYLRGGSERYLFELSELLKKNGHEVIPFSMENKRNKKTKYEKYFIKEVDLNKFSLKNIIKYFYNYEAVSQLKKLLAKEKIELAHLHNITGQLSPAIIKVLKNHNIPVVMTLHDYKLICPNAMLFTKGEICHRCQGGKYYNCLLNKCNHNSLLKSFIGMSEAYLNNKWLKSYKQIDLFISPSQYLKKIYIKFGFPKEKIIVMPNFIDINKFRITNEKEDNYLLYFGRLSKEKGIDTLIEAMAKLNTDLKLKIVGEGEEFMNYELSHAYRQAGIKNYGITNKVELIGAKYDDELAKLIKEAKAVVMPSIWEENMPYSLLESLAYDKVVIASAIGGIPEIIKDNVNGLLFEPKNSSDLAKKILKLGKINTRKIKKQTRASILKFNSQEHYNNIYKLYNNLILANIK
ncbi:MAG: glycosyltransferase family 4 protein [Patescibacteria group bacterium]